MPNYNAALLATLTGDPWLVTTIDIDGTLIEAARTATMHAVGTGMTIVQGDGRQGYADHAPYDRIIATASTPLVPLAWARQRAANGLLVCVVQPEYAPMGGLVRAEKRSDLVQGAVVHPAGFMVLHGEEYPRRTIQIESNALRLASFACDPTLFPPQLLWEEQDFAFFLYASVPDLHVFQRPGKGETIY